jgi:predicted secreted protein
MNKKFLYLHALLCMAGVSLPVHATCPNNNSRCAVLTSGVAHSKETMSASVDTVFYVSLEALPSAGYSWSITAIDGKPVSIERSGTGTIVPQTVGAVHILGDSYIVPGQAQQIGGMRLQQWQLKIDQQGTYTINFAYRRPWEKKFDPEKIHTVTVRVINSR